MNGHPLQALMAPRSIVVLGASPRDGALGNTVVRNLIDLGFSGPIYPVHPNAQEVCGIRAYADIAALPQAAECAVVCLSADKVIPALEEATASGVRAAVIFASGFAEAGAEGRDRQARLEALAMRTGLKVCGPNSLGLANISRGAPLYSAVVPETLRAGDVAVLSHSGSGCIVLSNIGRFGVSHLVSIGNGAVVDVDQYLDYLADDEATRVAALFIETIRNPAAFAAAAARMKAAGKAVVALKVGRSEKGAAATAAHTGSLSGANAVYEDFFKSCGVVSVEDIDELVESVVLMRAIKARPQGSGVAVLNVSGGEIALTCDVAQRVGVDLPDLSPETKRRLSEALPSFGHASNPLDVTGVAVFDMRMYGACIEALAADPAISIVAASQDCPAGLGSQQAEIYRQMAITVASLAPTLPKPIVFYSNVAGGIHPRVAEPLDAAGVPLLQGARASLLAIGRLCKNSVATQAAAERVEPCAVKDAWRRRFATGAPMTERETKLFLAEYGLPITREECAASAEEAGAVAERLSYPVVLKIESPDLPHKSDVGGVKIDLRSREEVERAYAEIMASVARLAPSARINGVLVQEMISAGTEVIVGATRESPFGMAVVVGAGGVLVELLRDSALALAPISAARAEDLIASTRVGALLAGYRGAPAGDIRALVRVVSTLSAIAAAYGDVIDAIDLNPISVGQAGKGVRIVDALLVPRAAGSQ
ncbi:MAG TPA: acetate--CoA ligase family protein [Roseiarcus sp.]|jgi:acyl-CoA synthetase (NDP forming)